MRAIAGCLETGGAGDADLPPPTPPTVVRGTGTVTASGPVLAVGSESTPFSVGKNVTLLLAEIAWEDEVQDIDLALASPSAGSTGAAQNFDHLAQAGSPGAPDSPHILNHRRRARGRRVASLRLRQRRLRRGRVPHRGHAVPRRVGRSCRYSGL